MPLPPSRLQPLVAGCGARRSTPIDVRSHAVRPSANRIARMLASAVASVPCGTQRGREHGGDARRLSARWDCHCILPCQAPAHLVFCRRRWSHHTCPTTGGWAPDTIHASPRAATRRPSAPSRAPVHLAAARARHMRGARRCETDASLRACARGGRLPRGLAMRRDLPRRLSPQRLSIPRILSPKSLHRIDGPSLAF